MIFFCLLYGIFFFLIGIGGFIPYFNVEGMFLGIFKTNVWLNCLYLISGIFSWRCFFKRRQKIRSYFQIIGILYGILALLGFLQKGDVLNILASNPATTWLHGILSILALLLGFGTQGEKND